MAGPSWTVSRPRLSRNLTRYRPNPTSRRFTATYTVSRTDNAKQAPDPLHVRAGSQSGQIHRSGHGGAFLPCVLYGIPALERSRWFTSLEDFAASMPATGGTHCRPPDLRLAFLCAGNSAMQETGPMRRHRITGYTTACTSSWGGATSASFLKNLARPFVMTDGLAAAYIEMADKARESEADEWREELAASLDRLMKGSVAQAYARKCVGVGPMRHAGTASCRCSSEWAAAKTPLTSLFCGR